MEARQNTLTITGLRTEFLTPEGPLAAVDGVDLAIPRGSIVGLVGESGCGKSVTALSVLGLVPPAGRVAAGEIRFGETDLRTLGEGALRKLRGNRIAMIFQDPMTSLNPVYPVGRQVAEVLRLHRRLDRWAAKARTVELFQQVGIPDPRCPLPGCRFCPRCDQSRQDCARQVPDLRALAAGHWVRCCHIS